MTYFCRPTRKLASHWFPRQKANEDCSIGFWIISENKLWYLHVLFSKIISTNEHHFYDFEAWMQSLE